MSGLTGMVWWLRRPFYQGFLLLVILITLFLGKPLFSDQPLVAADLLFQLDPLWQPLAPPGFTQPANPVLSDQALEFYPWKKFIREELAQGHVPLWNPYVNSGHPLLANAQSAPLDPLNLVALLWPLEKSFVVVAFLRLLCAGSFALLLALELGMSRAAAYLVMIVFTFAAPQVVWLLYPKASVLVWLPALLFLSIRLVRTGKWRYVTGLGLVMGMQFLGGHPETSLYVLLVWFVFCTCWLWLERRVRAQAPFHRILRQLALVSVLGLSAGAIQWLPVAAALWQSEILAARSQTAFTWQTLFFQWRDWLAALTMLMPDFFGNPRHHTYWYPYSNYTEQTLFVGILPLALAILVYVRGRGRAVNFFTTLGVISLGLALRLPGYPLLTELPLLSVTNSGRLRGVYMLVMAVLAGYGLDLVRESWSSAEPGGERNRRLWVKILVALAIVATMIALASYFFVTLFQSQLVELGRSQAVAAQGNPFFYRPLAEYLTLAQVRVEEMSASFYPANWRMYLPAILAVAMWGAGWLVWRFVHQPQRCARIISAVIVVTVVGELWLFGLDFNPTIPPQELYPTPALVSSLLQQQPPTSGQPYRVVGTGLALVPNVSMLFGLEDIRGYDPIAPRRYMELMNQLAGAVRVGHHLLFANADAPFLDFLNVRYAFATTALAGKWRPMQESHGVTLYANSEVMPRAFMVYGNKLASTPAESLAMTLAPDFDFRRSVVLERAAPEDTSVSPPPVLPSPPPQVEIVRAAPGEEDEERTGMMTIRVNTTKTGILVVSDPYTPGWVAKVDGKKTPLLIANHAFRALRVQKGDHLVTLQYRPISFAIGAWLSGLSLILLILIPILARKVAERKLYGRIAQERDSARAPLSG
jgi:hypothetical protein